MLFVPKTFLLSFVFFLFLMSLKFWSFNADGLPNKLDLLRLQISATTSLTKPHFIAICETHLSDAILDKDLRIPDYDLCGRRDRKSGGENGGGVLLYSHCSLNSVAVPSLDPKDP